MFIDEPYFMTNESWYHFDADKRIYILDDAAPKSAVESYNEFYSYLNKLSSTQ